MGLSIGPRQQVEQSLTGWTSSRRINRALRVYFPVRQGRGLTWKLLLIHRGQSWTQLNANPRSANAGNPQPAMGATADYTAYKSTDVTAKPNGGAVTHHETTQHHAQQFLN